MLPLAPVVLLGHDTSARQSMDQQCCRQLPATSRCVLLLLPFHDVAVKGVTSASSMHLLALASVAVTTTTAVAADVVLAYAMAADTTVATVLALLLPPVCLSSPVVRLAAHCCS